MGFFLALTGLWNGIGTLMAALALITLIIWRWRPARLLMIAVTFVLPGLLLIATPDTFYDFNVNHTLSYATGGVVSFPYPTFWYYSILGGSLDEVLAWRLWIVVNAALWLLCAVLLEPQSDLEVYTLIALPFYTVLRQGQTAIIILFGLTLLHRALLGSKRLVWIGGGIGLAIAALTKPQVALIGFGLLFCRESKVRWILGSALISSLLIVGLSLIINGTNPYREFLTIALPRLSALGQPGDATLINAAPSYALAALADKAMLSPALISLIVIGTSISLLTLAVVWSIQRRTSVELAAGWGVWAIVITPVAWVWYAAWAAPFFLLAERRHPERWPIFILVMGLLNLQWNAAFAFGALCFLLMLVLEGKRRSAAYPVQRYAL